MAEAIAAHEMLECFASQIVIDFSKFLLQTATWILG